jgi:hypothetical protein
LENAADGGGGGGAGGGAGGVGSAEDEAAQWPGDQIREPPARVHDIVIHITMIYIYSIWKTKILSRV